MRQFFAHVAGSGQTVELGASLPPSQLRFISPTWWMLCPSASRTIPLL
jgi:hypothetical protein